MSVHIGQVTSEVVSTPEPKAGGAAPPSGWAEADRRRREQARAERDSVRTRAEGFDD